MHVRRLAALAALSLAGAALLAGCGSSKPAYCTQVTNFESSVKALEKVEVSPTNLSGISTAVQNVGTSAKELASALKSEFAPQMSAVKASLAALEKSVKEVASAPSSSTLAHGATVIPPEVEALKHSAGEIQEVTKSKCE